MDDIDATKRLFSGNPMPGDDTTDYGHILGARIRVPARVARVAFADIVVMSTRLEVALWSAGVRVFGDLDGRSFDELTKLRGFGKKTLTELHRLLAERGGIDERTRVRTPERRVRSRTDAALLDVIDAAIEKLGHADGDVLAFAFGTRTRRTRTQMAKKFRVGLREGALLEARALHSLREAAGTRLDGMLRDLQMVRASDPQLFDSRWLRARFEGRDDDRAHAWTFYARIILALEPALGRRNTKARDS
jgi:hypothetical protein